MLEVKEIPVSGKEHPDPPDPVLLKHEFSIALIAPKGAGKTTLIINLLKFYKGYFNKIIVFSPTLQNDEKWDYARTLPLLKENKDLQQIIHNLRKKKHQYEHDNIPYNPPKFLFDEITNTKPVKFTGKIDESCLMSVYSEEDLQDIMDQQNEMINFLKNEGYSKHYADKILLVMDDLVGSNLYNNTKKNPFKVLCTTHRHLSISMLKVTQAYREIPKTIRTQLSALIIFRINNELERAAIIEEYPMGFTKNEWIAMYRECTNKKHGFMFIDTTKEIGRQIMCNFSYIVGNKYIKDF